MSNPFDELEAHLLTAVETAIITETTKFNLSRLVTLNPSAADKYKAALEALGR